MSVYKRDYARESSTGKPGKTPWAYSFCYEKIRYRKSGFLTKKEAALAEQKVRKEVILDGRRLAVFRYSTLHEMTEEYFDYRRVLRSAKTCKTERGHMRRLMDAMGNRRIDAITKATVQDYIKQRNGDGVSNRTINIELTTLRQMLAYAVDRGYAISNPAKEIKNLKEPRRAEVQIPTDEQFWQFVKAAGETKTGKELVTWIYVRAFTGMRENESFFLRWVDIDFERNLIRICPQLGNPLKNETSNRHVDIHPDLRVQLLHWKEDWDALFSLRGRVHDWVFYNPNDPSLRTIGFGTAFDNAKKKTGLSWINSRSFRHFFVSKAVMSGIDLLTIARWVGHASTEMINRIYGHLRPQHTAEQMKRISFAC